MAALVHMLHSIRLVRNTLWFSSNSATIPVAKVREHSLISLSRKLSTGKCIASDAPMLDSLLVSHHHCHIRKVVSVCWKAPSALWIKVNIDGFVIGNHGACGGLFHDLLGTFLGAFTCNLGTSFVFTTEVHMVLFWLWSMFPRMGGRTFGLRVSLLALFSFQKHLVGAGFASKLLA